LKHDISGLYGFYTGRLAGSGDEKASINIQPVDTYGIGNKVFSGEIPVGDKTPVCQGMLQRKGKNLLVFKNRNLFEALVKKGIRCYQHIYFLVKEGFDSAELELLLQFHFHIGPCLKKGGSVFCSHL